MRRTIDIFSAGELFVDLATAEFVQTLDETTLFKRALGGSAAKMAILMAQLGNKSMLAAAVGNDDMGAVLINHLNRSQVDTSYVAQVDEPTSLLLSMHSASKSSVQAYRGADAALSIRQFPFQNFENIGVFHTTCFALSRKNTEQVINQATERASRAKCLISLQINYSSLIFPDRSEAKKAVSEICRYNALVHISQADWEGLYDDKAASAQTVIDHFLRIGASEVCYSDQTGYWAGNDHETHHLPYRQESVNSSERFWAGYLTAHLDEKSPEECATVGRRMAEIKVPAHEMISREQIYEEILSAP